MNAALGHSLEVTRERLSYDYWNARPYANQGSSQNPGALVNTKSAHLAGFFYAKCSIPTDGALTHPHHITPPCSGRIFANWPLCLGKSLTIFDAGCTWLVAVRGKAGVCMEKTKRRMNDIKSMYVCDLKVKECFVRGPAFATGSERKQEHLADASFRHIPIFGV